MCVPFPFGVGDRMWNSIISVPELCLLSTLHYLEALKSLDFNLLRNSLECFIDQKRFYLPFHKQLHNINQLVFDRSKARSLQFRQFSTRA